MWNPYFVSMNRRRLSNAHSLHGLRELWIEAIESLQRLELEIAAVLERMQDLPKSSAQPQQNPRRLESASRAGRLLRGPGRRFWRRHSWHW